MAPKTIKFSRFSDDRGILTVCENEIPFTVTRIFFINGTTGGIRGGHGHLKNRMVLLCLSGKVIVNVESQNYTGSHILTNDGMGILIEPEHWHTMQFEDHNSILLVIASEKFDKADYFYEKQL